MSYLVLARKYRPQAFEDVVAQDHVCRTLANAISSGRVAHAILFAGPRGTGKTTVARILAKAMNCKEGPTRVPCNACRSCDEITRGHAVDVFEIDGASNNSVDQVRELRDNIRYRPAHSAYKIYIIDEVHMLSIAAFNALLKTLEEPPEHVLFLFATTEPHKIPVTILSRCQRHDMRRIDASSIGEHLRWICGKESREIDDQSLALIAREAGGSMRDALSLLDQIMACIDGPITEAQIVDTLGWVDRKIIFDVSEAIIARDVPGLLDYVDAIHSRGQDLTQFYTDLLDHFRNLLVVKLGKDSRRLIDSPGHEIERMAAQAENVSANDLNQIFDMLFKEATTVRYAAQPRLALEMVFLRLVQMPPILPIDTLIQRLEHLKTQISGQSAAGPAAVSTTDRSAGSPSVPLKDSQDHTAASLPPSADAAPVVVDSAENPEKAWERLRAAVSEKHPSLGPSLAQGTLKGAGDKKLLVEIEGNGLMANMIKKNGKKIQHVARTLFGDALRVELQIVKKASDQRQQKKKSEKLARQNALNHPLVAETLDVFDGKVVDVKTP